MLDLCLNFDVILGKKFETLILNFLLGMSPLSMVLLTLLCLGLVGIST